MRKCQRKELYPSLSTKNGKTSVQNPSVLSLGQSCILVLGGERMNGIVVFIVVRVKSW